MQTSALLALDASVARAPLDDAGEAAARRDLIDRAAEIAAAATGGEATGADVEAVHHRPGAGVSVVYAVSCSGRDERLVATTTTPRRGEGHDGVVTLDDGTRRIRAWWRRDDPGIPGLRHALDGATVARWLGEDAPARVGVLSYRPGRRAVLSVRAGSTQAYIKVVRPAKGAELRLRHELVAASPTVLAAPVPGVVVLEAAPGCSLAQALAQGDDRLLPEPGAVVDLLRTLPAEAARLDARPSWSDRTDFHAAAARAELPEHARRIEMLEHRLRHLVATTPRGPIVATHGDLNVANLFVAHGRPAALIDVDSVGPGRMVDDLATLLAHLQVLPALAPAVYPNVPAVTARWSGAFEREVDAAALQARTAAVLLSLVGGAGSVQAARRLALAEAAADRAEEAA